MKGLTRKGCDKGLYIYIYVVSGSEVEMLYCGTVLICNRQLYGDRSGNEPLYQL